MSSAELDMQVKFGYCVICDNGADRTNRQWVDDLMRTTPEKEVAVTSCHSCDDYPKENKNLLLLSIQIPEGLNNG